MSSSSFALDDDDDHHHKNNPKSLDHASSSGLHRRRTLYLVRHGQALHNVKEKEAQLAARQEAEALGLSEEETAERMETARKAVLQDHTLFDAPLTELGRQQAKQAGEQLAKLIDDGIAPAPTEAMVSPLGRCLETADILLQSHHNTTEEFLMSNSNHSDDCEQHDNDDDDDEEEKEQIEEQVVEEEAPSRVQQVQLPSSRRRHQRRSTLLVHIRPELRERQTQYPPDTPQTPDQLYHWTQQRVAVCNGRGYRFHAKALTGHELEVEESRTQLRERAGKLFDVLLEMSHRHILIVSHKGYLREMERGLLGLTDSPLFDNAEVRVYRVIFTRGDRELESVERLA